MSNLYFSFSIVFPLACMMALGYFLKAIGMLHDAFLKKLNQLCFKVFLPVMLFYNVYRSDFSTAFSPMLVLFSVGCVFVVFFALFIFIPLIEKNDKRRGAMMQGIFRSNFVLFGIPTVVSLVGEKNSSVAAILIAFVVPLFNALSVITLERFSGRKTNVKAIVVGVVTNPLILASAAAFFFILTGLRLPQVVVGTVNDIGKIATPLALITLGGGFSFQGLGHAPKALAISVLGKLVLLPVLFLPLGLFFGFRGAELAALFAMLASPTAVSSYTMAQSMDSDATLAGQIVVIDSVCSIFTIFVGITLLKSFAFF